MNFDQGILGPPIDQEPDITEESQGYQEFAASPRNELVSVSLVSSSAGAVDDSDQLSQYYMNSI